MSQSLCKFVFNPLLLIITHNGDFLFLYLQIHWFFFVLSNLFLNYLLSFSFIIVVFLAINFPSDSSLSHSFAETLLYDEVLFLNKFLWCFKNFLPENEISAQCYILLFVFFLFHSSWYFSSSQNKNFYMHLSILCISEILKLT